jgi:hypothetical protein
MRIFLYGLLAILCSEPFSAQPIIPPDAALQRAVSQVSADSLRADVHVLVNFGTRHTLSNQTDPNRGIGAARRWVLARFRQHMPVSGGRLSAKIVTWEQPQDQHRVNRLIHMGNVVATLKGTDPSDKRIFMVTAHLDSRATDVMDSTITAPGANDDGSGVASLLEMVRVLSKYPMRATVMFVAVTGEEQGLLGSTHLAQQAVEQHWEVAAMINNDMIGQSMAGETGNRDNTRVRVFSEGIPMAETAPEKRIRLATGGENDSRSRQLARYIKMVGETFVDNLTVQLIYRQDRFLRGGDQEPFQERGFTAVRLTDFYEQFDHQHQTIRTEDGVSYGDLEKYMDFEYLRKNTCLNLVTLYCLANAPSVPRNVVMDVRHLGNTTRLVWEPPQYGVAEGYVVWMRETDAPLWQRKRYTQDTSIILPYSKDNYFFAVQAVGKDGMPSLPVFPGIGR